METKNINYQNSTPSTVVAALLNAREYVKPPFSLPYLKPNKIPTKYASLRVTGNLYTTIAKINTLAENAVYTRRAGTDYVQFRKQELRRAFHDLNNVFYLFKKNPPQLQINAHVEPNRGADTTSLQCS